MVSNKQAVPSIEQGKKTIPTNPGVSLFASQGYEFSMVTSLDGG